METEVINDLVEYYKLNKKEHMQILEKLIKEMFINKSNQKEQSVIFVIGQPGSGKTTFIQNTDLSDFIIINSDDYRHLIKYSDEILNKYPTYYARLTNYDVHLWGDELFDYAVSNGYSVLREKTPTNYDLLEVIKPISNKSNVVINVVVTGNLSSLIATRERYEKEILISNNAKLSSIEAHNKCYDLLPSFISKCLTLNIKVNYVVLVGNEYEVIPVNNDYLELLNRIRKESNRQTCIDYEKRMTIIKQAMLKRNAPQEQFDNLNEIKKIYTQIINGKNIINNYY